MKIAELLEQSLLSQTRLAELAGTTQKTISELANEVGRAALPLAVRIERVTYGLVTADEVPLHEEDKEALEYLRPNGPARRKAA